VTEARAYEQLAQGRYLEADRPRCERSTVKLKFHGTDTDTDTDTDILADFRARIVARMSACPATSKFPVQLATSRTRTTILADLSADLSETRAFPREDVRVNVYCTRQGIVYTFTKLHDRRIHNVRVGVGAVESEL